MSCRQLAGRRIAEWVKSNTQFAPLPHRRKVGVVDRLLTAWASGRPHSRDPTLPHIPLPDWMVHNPEDMAEYKASVQADLVGLGLGPVPLRGRHTTRCYALLLYELDRMAEQHPILPHTNAEARCPSCGGRKKKTAALLCGGCLTTQDNQADGILGLVEPSDLQTIEQTIVARTWLDIDSGARADGTYDPPPMPHLQPDSPALYQLWQTLGSLPEDSHRGRAARIGFSRRLSWAIPSPTILKRMVAQGPIVEVGAGNGYWARQLTEAGGDVIAYDLAGVGVGQEHNEWHDSGGLFAPVQYGDATVGNRHSERTLLLCWPPEHTGMAEEALRSYQGDRLIYIGWSRAEGQYPWTGGNGFHDLLEHDWVLEDRWEDLPRWDGNEDRVYLYTRKSLTTEAKAP